MAYPPWGSWSDRLLVSPLADRANELEHTLVRNLLGQATHEPIVANAIEEVLQIDIDPVAMALLQIGLGHRVVSGAPRPKAIAGRGKRRVPCGPARA